MDPTINYYNINANKFISTTLNVDFTETQDDFLSLLPAGAFILDFGCGSGRDTKYFLDHGFQVDAIDGSEAMCRQAAEYTGMKVKQMYFQDLDAIDKYDGIWACSSILHLNKRDLETVFCKMQNALKQDGILYTSFKYGTYEGEHNGRYFTFMTEDSYTSMMKNYPQLQMVKMWVTSDVRPGREQEKWLNILMKKVSS